MKSARVHKMYMKNAIFASQKLICDKIENLPPARAAGATKHLWHIGNDTHNPRRAVSPTRRAATLFVLLQRVFPKFKSADIFNSERGFC